MELHAVKNIGAEHAKWSPVGALLIPQKGVWPTCKQQRRRID
jgi:hypothetical protein